ncbi:MAG: hypothetical protein NTY32_00635 [Bacteroidia bacterium]|nr:hypothetical protein [Bacteroidia bacterium]
MKSMITIFFLLFLTIGIPVQSQPQNRNQPLRERIDQAKMRQIRLNLQMDEATFAHFRPLYLKYERALASIDFRSQNNVMKVQADSLSTQDADRLILAQWEGAKQLTAIREKAYTEFRKILTAQQLVRLYQTETEIRKKVMSELGKRRRKAL